MRLRCQTPFTGKRNVVHAVATYLLINSVEVIAIKDRLAQRDKTKIRINNIKSNSTSIVSS